MQGWSPIETRQRCEVPDIRLLLEQGQLAGYATVRGPRSNIVVIPQSVWTDVEIVDENGSCLVHRLSKAEFFDLRIYPVLHAPDAPELLHDRGLGEVFMTSVIKDPEVAALGRRVMASEGYRHVFLEGNAPGPYIDSHWAVDADEENLAFEFVRPIVWSLDTSLPRPSAAIMAAAKVLADRIAALRELLSAGRVAAIGTHPSSGQFGPINRGQWLRKDIAIDVPNADLCEPDGSKWAPLWTGIILESAKGAGSLNERFQHVIGGGFIPRRSSSAAEARCRLWLERLVREHPVGRTKSKQRLFEEAQREWDGLSRESFERAWNFATAGEAGEEWRKAGAPRKHLRQKSPGQ